MVSYKKPERWQPFEQINQRTPGADLKIGQLCEFAPVNSQV